MNLTEDLETWVQTFLRGPGNNVAFADGLNREPRSFFGPLGLSLQRIPRCCGPEEGMKYRNPREDFERRVEGLRAHFRSGAVIPPLITCYTGGSFELNDGNHRHEALVREGVTSFPCIVWTTGDKDRAAFLEAYEVWLEISRSYDEGRRLGRQGIVGCLVTRPDGRIFAQRRALSRKTFPGCWDLVGGHVEPGETPEEALVRELREETGWELDHVLGLRATVDWESPGPQEPRRKREFVVAVTVKGGWDHPSLEAGKVTEGRWFSAAELGLLNENRDGKDTYVYDLVRKELAL